MSRSCSSFERRTLTRWLLVAVLFASCAAFGCGRIDADSAKREFEAAHPSREVVEVFVGEGDGDAAYVHIRYREPGEPHVREAVWGYLRDPRAEGWRVFHKDEPKPGAPSEP